jgi:sec-independent protein translocase protein TatC
VTQELANATSEAVREADAAEGLDRAETDAGALPLLRDGSDRGPASKPSAGGKLEEKPMTFWEHLDELRKRLIRSVLAFIVGCVAAWELREEILAFLVKPFAESWTAQGLTGAPTLHFDAPGAAFTAYVRMSMLGGLALAAPVIFYQLWSFIAPGLYAKEKRFVIPFVLLSSVLFVGGGLFGWKAAFPITFDYFLSMSGAVGSQHLTITPTVMIGQYLDFVSQMLLAFGLIFELPLVLLFLSIAGLINYLHLIKFGRWFVLVAFVVAAIATPPDVTSQLVMAIPMLVLYVVSIGLAFLFGKSPTDAQREAFKNRKKSKD